MPEPAGAAPVEEAAPSGPPGPRVCVFHDATLTRGRLGHLIGYTEAGEPQVRLNSGETVSCPKESVFFRDGEQCRCSLDGRSRIVTSGDGSRHLVPLPRPRRARGEGRGHREGSSGLPERAYCEVGGKLWTTGDEESDPILLANFTARIKKSVVRHEGGKPRTRYVIEATHSDSSVGRREITVEADEYPAMRWPYVLGAAFSVGAGRGVADHARHAIQLLSQRDGIESAVEHASLGWIEHEGRWLYLHAGGALGADGPSRAVRVDPPGGLEQYRLPDPPTDPDAVRDAVRAPLSIWTLEKAGTPGARMAAAIIATSPWRAVLSPCNGSTHLGGPSGHLKTSTARLALQHFAADHRGLAASMPAGWSDTRNSLQRRAYDCCCSLLVVDDLKEKAHLATSEGIFQSQGNLRDRARMGSDQSLLQSLPPRGSILSTGEVDPHSASTCGRVLAVELGAGDIRLDLLDPLQRAGDDGLYALAMAAYVRWLAPRLDDVRSEHERLTDEIRRGLGEISGAHPRHPDAVAQLIAAYRLFLEFASEVGAIDAGEAEGYAATARGYLLELARAQAEPQREAKVGRTFLRLIASALSSKQCHLIDAHRGHAPTEYAGACGWAKTWLYTGRDTGPAQDWEIPANSKLVGFIDLEAKLVYLDPEPSAAAATRQAESLGTPQSFKSVGRELLNEKLCRPHKDSDGTVRTTQPKRIKNHGTKRYLYISIADLFGDPDEEALKEAPANEPDGSDQVIPPVKFD
jgi:hypothetical protein